MEKRSNLKKPLLWVAVATLSLLLIPFAGMQFTGEVDWSAGDFIIMGALLFGTGLAWVLLTRFAGNLIYKAAAGIALGTTFLMIWANLAVGLIGSGAHWGNLLYIGVIAVAVIGSMLSRFSARGMERSMYAASFSLVLLAAIALLAEMDAYPGSSVTEILGVNGFFALLYLFAGFLFRYSPRQRSTN